MYSNNLRFYKVAYAKCEKHLPPYPESDPPEEARRIRLEASPPTLSVARCVWCGGHDAHTTPLPQTFLFLGP